jgi:hypothetical protein
MKKSEYLITQKASAFIPDSIEWEILLRVVWMPMVCADSLQYFQPSMFAYCLVSDRMCLFALFSLSLSEGGGELNAPCETQQQD